MYGEDGYYSHHIFVLIKPRDYRVVLLYRKQEILSVSNINL